MKVLVVGTGARENAIADALKDDVELYVYMSKLNPGMSKIAEYKQGDEGEVEKVAEYAVENDIDIAFMPCNQPYTMTPDQLVKAARTVQPKVLFPYHYSATDVSGIPAALQGIDVRIRQYQ